MRKANGITMITLVVTIIVLIILAGVSINMIVGDNGIITLAQKAKENTELAKVQEEEQLNSLYEELIHNGEGIIDAPNTDAVEKLENFKKIIATAVTNEGVETEETDTAETMAENIAKILEERTKDATATAEDITEGKTAYVNGQKIEGSKITENLKLEQSFIYRTDGGHTTNYVIEKSGTYILFVTMSKAAYNSSNSSATLTVSGYETLEVIYDVKQEFGFSFGDGGQQQRVYCAKLTALEGNTIQIVDNIGNGYPIEQILFLSLS